jgi:hypothetical protein
MKREKGLKNKGFLNSRCFSKGFLFLFRPPRKTCEAHRTPLSFEARHDRAHTN